MNELNNIGNYITKGNYITSKQPNELLRIILYGNWKFKDNVNKLIMIVIDLINSWLSLQKQHKWQYLGYTY